MIENRQIRFFREEADKSLRADQIKTDNRYLAVYSSDASIYSIKPSAVITVGRSDDITAVVNACRKFALPITARGGGTGLAGGAVGNGVILDFCDYDKMMEIDSASRLAKVSAGVIYDDLNLKAAEFGLMFPPDPSSGDSCRIGGMLGNNSSGARTVRYGTTRDYTRALSIITSQGKKLYVKPLEIGSGQAKIFLKDNPDFAQVLKLILANRDIILPRRRNVRKNSSGYDLWSFLNRYEDGWIDFTKILVGSEGTLCIFESAELALEPLPPKFFTALIFYKEYQAVGKIIPHLLDLKPYSLEVADGNSMNMIGRRKYGLPDDATVMLLMQFELERQTEIGAFLDKIINRNETCGDPVLESDVTRQNSIWAARRALLPSLYKYHPKKKPLSFVEDACLPPEKLPQMFEFLERTFGRLEMEYGSFGHIGDGNIHIKPLVDASDASDRQKMRLISSEIYNEILRMGGVISGEHADGRVRAPFLRYVYGEEVYSIFVRIKKILDPEGILNPGVKLSAHTDITESMDVPRLNWDCSQCGKCVPSCPSFAARKSELFSPRGRIKMSNYPGIPTSDKFISLETCINCKNCRTICPSGCDASSDSLQFKGKHRKTLLEPMLGLLNYPALMRRASALGSLGFSLIEHSYPRRMLEFISRPALMIDKRAQLPAPAAKPFSSNVRLNPTPEEARIAYFYGCADGYLENQTADAIVRIFQNQGIALAVPEQVCCGVPAESYGFNEHAAKSAALNIESLNRYDYVITACGTCLLMLRDYPHLFSQNDRLYSEAKTLSAKVYEVTEFLLKFGNKMETSIKEKVTYHDSCHLRCAGVETAPREFLRRLGVQFVEMEYASRCCGFAGTHYFNNPTESEKIFEIKKRSVEKSQAKIVASCCPTCILQFGFQLNGIESVHPILLVQQDAIRSLNCKSEELI